MTMEPSIIRTQDASGKIVQAGLSWLNPIPNVKARDRGDLRQILWIFGLAAGLFMAFMWTANYNQRGWGSRPGEHTYIDVLCLIGALILGCLGAYYVFLRYKQDFTRSNVVFTRDEIKISITDSEAEVFPIDGVRSIEESPTANKSGGHFKSFDIKYRQSFLAYDVSVFMASGITLQVGLALPRADARLIVVQLNEAMALMRQRQSNNKIVASKDW